ncbi:MAG: aminodeoxychorismate lyase [Rhodanobacter sp.]
MNARVLVNGLGTDSVSALDRGLAYGDGLFETIRLVDGTAPFWPRHMQRLAAGCARLGLPKVDADGLWREALQVTQAMPQAVVRITLTRGIGQRGYALPIGTNPTRIVAGFEPPVIDRSVYRDGLRLRVCELRLASQPLLAGIKHLNRLEQVLARAEWDDPTVEEGVLRDIHGNVVSAISANLFAVVAGRLRTPAVDRCGVAGVGRAEVLAVCPHSQVGLLSLEALFAASEVFLVSSVRGVVPVRCLARQGYAPGATTRRLQQHWHELGFPMEQAG